MSETLSNSDLVMITVLLLFFGFMYVTAVAWDSVTEDYDQRFKK